MVSKSNYLIGALAVVAVMIGALPAAQGIGAATKELPNVQVDRSAKGDRLAEPRTIAVKKAPTETAREYSRGAIACVSTAMVDGAPAAIAAAFAFDFTAAWSARVPKRCSQMNSGGSAESSGSPSSR